MIKITVDVDGMACGMCEAHINDAVRRNFTVKKVTSSHSKRKTEIIAEAPLDAQALKAVIAQSGYTVTGIHGQCAEKCGIAGRNMKRYLAVLLLRLFPCLNKVPL